MLRVKDGVLFTKIAPAGFVLLSALLETSNVLGEDLTITSACDGEHSGPTDPHPRGEAYDVRTHGLRSPLLALGILRSKIPGYESYFYAFLEDPDTDNEHIHCQVKKGVIYSPAPNQAPGLETDITT